MGKFESDILVGTSSVVYIRESFDDIYPLLQEEREVIFIVDRAVDKVYDLGRGGRKIVIDGVEKNKNLAIVDGIINQLLSLEASRDCFLVGVGGGVTTDVVGFVASIYKRGVRFALAPTSVLSQVDASVGGKTGVNYGGYKNVVGTFYQPAFSFINISFLRSLSQREFLSGVVEMLKGFVIADREHYGLAIDFFRKNVSCLEMIDSKGKRAEFKLLLKRAIEIKAMIVERDEREAGERKLLNLGHTFGHAIEKCSFDGSRLLHGEAVSVGMMIAARISHRLGVLAVEELDGLEKDLTSIGLPTRTDFSIEELVMALKNDKKREDDSLHFVLISGVGQAYVEKISINKLKEVAYDLC